jgi:hypothetical protein
MYLHKFLVFQVLLLHVSTSPVSTTDPNKTLNLEKNLIQIVSSYNSRIEKNGLLSSNPIIPQYTCGRSIQLTDVQYLEENIFNILKQLNNHYYETLPNLHATIREDHFEELILSVFQSTYVEIICSRISRCIDFIYMCSPTLLNFGKILTLHADVCHSRETYIKEYHNCGVHFDAACSYSENSLAINRLNLLYDRINKNRLNFMKTQSDYTANDLEFIYNISKIINEIDKTDIILEKIRKRESSSDDYSYTEKLRFQIPQSSRIIINNKDFPELNKINQELKNIIFEQGTKLLNTNDNLEKKYLDKSLLVLNEILLNAIQGILIHFRQGVFQNDQNDLSISVDYQMFKNILSVDMLNKVCMHIPLILYHLYENGIKDSIVFNSYLLLCSDWTHFLNVRCQLSEIKNGVTLYNLQCLQQSINEILLFNYDLIKQKTEHDESFKNPDKQYLETIILNIHTRLYEFYVSKNIYIWQSFEWLGGTHIFNLTQSENPLNELIEYIVTYENENLPFFKVYDQLLPWNLNIESLIDFKIRTDNIILDNLFQFVWCQARIINLFFENYRNLRINEKVLQLVKESIKWYKLGTPELYKIISLTNNHFTVPENIKSVITAIENSSSGILYLIHTDTLKKNKSKREYCPLNNEAVNFPIYHMFLENCFNAVNLINGYFRIMKEANVTIYNTTNDFFLGPGVCTNNNLSDLFKEVEIPILNEEFWTI